jgi:putative transposase
MPFRLSTFHVLVTTVAGWIHREQQLVIEYLRAENKVLQQHVPGKRLLLSDDQRRVLAVKGKVLGRKLLGEFGTLFSPDTILGWHRKLVAQKWTHPGKTERTGRPTIDADIAALVVRLAKENPTWGYERIQGAITNLGHELAASTIANILREHGLEPAPDRKRSPRWKEFLAAHWDAIAATDFFTTEVWTKGGLVTFYVLFVIDLATRRVKIAGITPHPNEAWMRQMACNLTDAMDGALLGKKFLIMDRDTKFCAKFKEVLLGEGVEPVVLPPKSPNLNAYAERFVRSIKEECLNRLIFFGERTLRNAIAQFVDHYHAERNHQALGNKLIDPGESVGSARGKIVCYERLGGMLKYYHRRAA